MKRILVAFFLLFGVVSCSESSQDIRSNPVEASTVEESDSAEKENEEKEETSTASDAGTSTQEESPGIESNDEENSELQNQEQNEAESGEQEETIANASEDIDQVPSEELIENEDEVSAECVQGSIRAPLLENICIDPYSQTEDSDGDGVVNANDYYPGWAAFSSLEDYQSSSCSLGAIPQDLIAGELLSICQDGYKPDSKVTIMMYSEPTLLAELSVDQDGVINEEVRIPLETELGNHSLEILGLDPDGAPKEFTVPIIVGRDTDPPVIQSITFSQENVDISEGGTSIQVTIQASDEKLGIHSIGVSLSGCIKPDDYEPGPDQCNQEQLRCINYGGFFPIRWPMLDFEPQDVEAQLIDGTPNDGTWATTITIPSTMPSCSIGINDLSVCDYTGNCVQWNPDFIDQGQWPPSIDTPTLNIINTNFVEDTEAPELTSLTISDESVDISNGSASITVAFSANDALTGVRATSITFSQSECANPGGFFGVQIAPLSEPWAIEAEIKNGDSTNGIWEAEVTIPDYFAECTFTLNDATVCDNAANCIVYTNNESYIGGVWPPPFPLPELSIINNNYQPDTEDPVLTGLTFSETSIDVTSGAVTIIATIQATDNQTGISGATFTFGACGEIAGPDCPQEAIDCNDSGAYIEIRWPTLDWPGGSLASLTQGNNTNGVWTAEVTIPSYTPSCTVSLQSAAICDNANNCVDYQPIANPNDPEDPFTWPLPVASPTLTIVNDNID